MAMPLAWSGTTLLLAVALTGLVLPVPAAAPAQAPASAAVTAAARDRAPAFDTAPAEASLRRLLPAHATQFRLLAEARATTASTTAASTTAPTTTAAHHPADSFTLGGTAGAITVRATSPATLLSGVGWYLAHVAGVDLGWPGDSLDRLPATLPAPAGGTTRTAAVPHRYALNDTDAGYSGPYRDFAAYQHEIDLLALHGVNEVFVQTGAEYPYLRALRQFGYRDEELRAWVPAPGHQSWWLLQNMAGFGGPESARLAEARAALGRLITDQLRALGMTPVLPGFFGTVPPGFAQRNAGARTVPQGEWVGFARPDWLDPTGPVFDQLAAAYYRAQRERFGDSTMYKMDLLHEGGLLGPVDATGAARAVQQALDAAHPGATWVLLGWEQNPTAAVLNGVDRARMLILDGLADRYDGLDREGQWGGTPYAFGTIDNFGGHTGLGANTAVWTDRFRRWLTKPGSALAGLAYLPEGTGGNPAAFALFTELAWQQRPVDQRAWFADYAARRYGGPDEHAAAAWELLRSGPYSTPSDGWSEPADSLFAARPALDAGTAATWSPGATRYPPAAVAAALGELLRVAPESRGTDAYRFDLVDVARQVLGNRARALLPHLAAAYGAHDRAAFRALAERWTADEALLDRLLATDSRFLLGPWLTAARSWGEGGAESDQLEYDARSLLTTWGGRGPSEQGQLHDYANREWSGLVADVYAPRWAAYFASLDTAMADGREPVAIDWFSLDDAWAHRTTAYPTTPVGDPVEAARAVADQKAANQDVAGHDVAGRAVTGQAVTSQAVTGRAVTGQAAAD
ncbi:alpha-N-acetylglucosaminidase [Kitasatospora sp. NBC_01287]|uniref:alpha-N-acetylglucosaminidase n=1 Tax=Kitasatospora sp. NBC_01287 TaxID=2903573 RepID=UPI00225C0BD5|nr:alpha-N-acetylglucosaminidase [Kitasatospora sp. NBC_01287]MCX4744283.1 alpha-N-acetylglucosaminidase [Kitasatospora sp. NBC_01287]